jgi:predicted transcriptional regulator
MPDEKLTTQRRLAVEIVAAYVGRNQINADQLAALIATTHQALGQLGEPATEAVVEQTPAVSIRQSVRHDHVVCMDCGWRGQMLRRHISAAHGLSVEEYRRRWSLSHEHPMTAPGYSERRSTMAKQLGLGRARGASVKALEPAAPPTPKRRGRPPRSAATPT